MTKKILLIGNTTSRSVIRLKQEADAQGVVLDVVKPVNISLCDGMLAVHDVELRFSPLEYDVYFFRGIGRSMERMKEIARFLKGKNKRVVERILTVEGLPEDKLVSESKSGTYAIPEQLIMAAQMVTKDTVKNFPVIVKKFSSSMGKGVVKINSLSELLSFVQTVSGTIVIQRYYPLDFDVRVVVVGDKVVGGLARYKPAGEDFLTTRRGGRREAIAVTEVIEQAALEASKLQGLEIAGVDLFLWEGKPYLLEVNASPQFFVFEKVTSKNAALEILHYLLADGVV